MRFLPNMLLAGAGLLLAGCAVPTEKEPETNHETRCGMTLEIRSAAGKPVRRPRELGVMEKNVIYLHGGETLEVRLPGNATTGYLWQMSATGEEAAAAVEYQDYCPGDPALCGAPGEAVWRVRALRPGSREFVFRYFRPWEKFDPAHDPMRRVTVTVLPPDAPLPECGAEGSR